MTCRCGAVIPPERLEAVPGTTTCVRCSSTKRVRGVVSWDAKDTSTLSVVRPEVFERVRAIDARLESHDGSM